MPEILTDAYLLFTFVFKQALNIVIIQYDGRNSFYTGIIWRGFQCYGPTSAIYRHFKPLVNTGRQYHDIIFWKTWSC